MRYNIKNFAKTPKTAKILNVTKPDISPKIALETKITPQVLFSIFEPSPKNYED